MEKLATKVIDLGDARLAYREHGEGPNLLLLHGNSESKAIFKKIQLVHLRDFHTLAVDSRGHGESQSEDDEYSIRQYAEDMVRACKAKGIEKAYVIGYSDGGNIALHLAKMAPEVFERIAAISPNTLASGTQEGTLKLFQFTARVCELLGKCGLPTKKMRMRLNLMLTDIGISESDLNGIRTRVKILYAERDLIKEEHIAWIGRSIPGAEVEKIAGCNHMTILQKKETIEAMRAFFEGA